MKKRIALVLALLLALTLTGCKSNDYKSAVNAMERGDYATAAQQLEALGDYQDSKQLLKQCRYALAVEDFNAGNYESALEAFQALGDYIDAVSYASRAQDGLLRQKIAGSWHSETLDVTELFLNGAESQMEGIAEALREQGVTFQIVMNCSFAEDGTCSMVGTVVDMDGFVEKVNSFLRDLMTQMLEQEFAAEGYTLEEVYALLGVNDADEVFQAVTGMTIQEYIDELGLQELLNIAVEALKFDGSYTVEDGVILCNGDKIRYDADTDTLKLLFDDETEKLMGVDALSMSRG